MLEGNSRMDILGEKMKQIAYEYKNCPIPGGGFVTGLLFEHGQERMYARTDIGGLYRRDFGHRCWVPLNDDVTAEELAPTYPLSIAVDAGHPGYLYAVCGTRRGEHGYLMVSHDAGENFVLKPLPCGVHGNMPGRSTGERLHCEDGVIYFASQTAGLWRSQDEGERWQKLFVREDRKKEEAIMRVRKEGKKEEAAVRVREAGKKEEAAMRVQEEGKKEEATVRMQAEQENEILPGAQQNLTFLWKKENVLVVGCNGEANRVSENMRGATLYISYDAGKHFETMPVPRSAGGFEGIAGFVPQRCCWDGKFLYVTFTETEGRHYAGFGSYSFDTGSCRDGRVWRYQIPEEAPMQEISAEDITPFGKRLITENFSLEAKTLLGSLMLPEKTRANAPHGEISEQDGKGQLLCGGISGIDVCGGLLLCSTGGMKSEDAVFASMDAGEHWLPVLCGLAVGRFFPEAVSYMKPEYNGGGSIVHWIADIKINPHCPDEAYFTTGTGIFCCEGLDAVRQWLSMRKTDTVQGNWGEEEPHRLLACYPDCMGLEETVHLNVYSLPQGAVRLVDIVGDLGGFSFTDPQKQCENSFADEKGDRYITCLNADFPEQHPNMLVTGARGNWSGRTKGGALLSYDQGQHFIHLPYPEGISERLDALVEGMKRPNVDAGYVAMTADGSRVLWAVAERGGFLSDCVVYMDVVPRTECAQETQESERTKSAQDMRENERMCSVKRKEEENISYKKWSTSQFFDRARKPLAQPVPIQLYADRINPKRMYAFATGGRIFLSENRGECFYETEAPDNFPETLFSRRALNGQVTADYGEEGVLYLAVQESGLYRLTLREDPKKRWDLKCLTNPGDYACCVGLGCAGKVDEDFGNGEKDMEPRRAEPSKIIYIVGKMNGRYGFYRSFDNGTTWERINHDGQMFGEIRAICGDRREAGVFYLASGTRGLLCGKPKF